MDVTLGQVVYSKAGRDSGRPFIVVGIVDSMYVQISDGNLRRIEKPKKKKIKHLDLKDSIVEHISERFKDKVKISNSDIRKSLEEFTKEAEH